MRHCESSINPYVWNGWDIVSLASTPLCGMDETLWVRVSTPVCGPRVGQDMGGIVGFDLDCPRQGEAKTLHYEWGHHKSRATEVEAVSELLSHSNLMNILFSQCDCGLCVFFCPQVRNHHVSILITVVVFFCPQVLNCRSKWQRGRTTTAIYSNTSS